MNVRDSPESPWSLNRCWFQISATITSRDHILRFFQLQHPSSTKIQHGWLQAVQPFRVISVTQPAANYDSFYFIRANYSLIMLQTSWQPCSDVPVLEKGASPPAKRLYNMDSYDEYYCYLYRGYSSNFKSRWVQSNISRFWQTIRVKSEVALGFN